MLVHRDDLTGGWAGHIAAAGGARISCSDDSMSEAEGQGGGAMGQLRSVELQEGLRVATPGDSPAASPGQMWRWGLGVRSLPVAHLLQSHCWGLSEDWKGQSWDF